MQDQTDRQIDYKFDEEALADALIKEDLIVFKKNDDP
jgi:hypothetical protein